MKTKDLEKKIEDLQKRIDKLENRPVPYVYTLYPPYSYQPNVVYLPQTVTCQNGQNV